MLWKLLLALTAVFSHHDHRNAEQHEDLLPTPPNEEFVTTSPDEFVPTPHGPQTLEEEAAARAALHGEHYGGDMIFPDDWNATDAGMRDTRFRWPGYPGGATIPFVIDRSAWNFRNVIYQGMQQYHQYTCIRFVERTNQRHFIRIFYGNGYDIAKYVH